MDDTKAIQTEELERSVIGALCLEPRSAKIICPLLQPEDFSNITCKAVFESASDAVHSQKPFDAVIAADGLSKSMGENDAREFIRLCMVSTTTAANAEYHAKLLHQRSAGSRLRNDLLGTLMDGDAEPKDMVASIISQCRSFLESEKSGRTVTMEQALEKMYSGLGDGERQIRVDTGFPRLDKILQGIWGGNLCVIGARPGVGKSAMALSIAENVAKTVGPVIIYSMEMLDEEVAERSVARNSTVTLDDLINSQNLDNEKYSQILRACEMSAKLRIYINDSPNMTVGKIRSEVAAMEGLKLIIVDFLNIMGSDKRYEKRYLEIGAISRDLKNLASELRVPIVALCQLNREHTDGERPTLSDLRDSGEIEQNANKVLLMWNEDKDSGFVGVSVAKNRRGKTGAVVMNFDGDHMRFMETDITPSSKKRPANRNDDSAW